MVLTERVGLFLVIERCASAFLARDKPEESMVSVVRNVNHRSLIASDYTYKTC